MGTDPKRQVELLRSQLESGERGGSEPDRTLALRFLRWMSRWQENYGDYRRAKLLRHIVITSEADLTPTLEHFVDAQEADDSGVESDADTEALLEADGILGGAIKYRAVTNMVVDWINQNHDNEETNRDYRQALRTFEMEMYNEDGIAPSISWVSSSYPRNYDPTPSRIDILDWEEDVQPMIEAESNDRTRAMMALGFDAGPRSGEMYDMRVGDLEREVDIEQVCVYANSYEVNYEDGAGSVFLRFEEGVVS